MPPEITVVVGDREDFKIRYRGHEDEWIEDARTLVKTSKVIQTTQDNGLDALRVLHQRGEISIISVYFEKEDLEVELAHNGEYITPPPRFIDVQFHLTFYH